ncbi:Non-hem dioxygenase N-terminal domain [Dillenia turbinata]|uniref:Non-hem dioxygenase N-terminal domain n=1 Tax=Dillenia turbinata TaxID=194707 RepID=A0AAN8UXH0_9MAGN
MDSTPEGVNLGKSLIVPSVQELARQPITNIPPRYMRADDDRPIVVFDGASTPPVPVIDLQKLLHKDPMNSELEKLHSACKEWGFFQIVNHGVNALLLEKFKTEIGDFFKLPHEEKKKLWHQPDNLQGFGQHFVVSEEQKLDWSDMFFITTLPINLRRNSLFEALPPQLRREEGLENWEAHTWASCQPPPAQNGVGKPNPTHHPTSRLGYILKSLNFDMYYYHDICGISNTRHCTMYDFWALHGTRHQSVSIFIETLEAYSLEAKNLAMTILTQMAKTLGMKTEEMTQLFNDGMQTMRMNYYPPCPEPDIAIGLTPHSDACALTILYQLNDTEGLQIRKDGKWVPVKPLEDAFVVNIGGIMEIISNGVYKSIEHRAIVNSAKERLSVATFYSSKLDSQLGPASSLISPQNPPVFQRTTVELYYKEYFARKLNGKSFLDLMKIKNVKCDASGSF